MDESPQELLIIASYHDVFDERRKAFVMLCDMLHDPSNFLGACKAIYTLSSEKFDEDSKDQNRTFRKIAESAAALAARLLLSKINSDASAGNFRAVLAVLEDPDIFQNARIAANYLLEPTAENAIKRSTNIIGDEELQVELIEITLSPRITPDIKQKASRRLSYLAAIIGELKSEKSAQDLLIIASHHENNQERMQAIATLCSWISYPGKEACACRSIRMLSKSSGIQDAEVAKEIKTAKYLAISYLLDNLEAHVAAGNYCEVSGLAGDQTLFSTVRDAANSNLETTAMQTLKKEGKYLDEKYQQNLFAVSIGRNPALRQLASDRLTLVARNIRELHKKEHTARPPGIVLSLPDGETTPNMPSMRLVESELTPKAPKTYEKKARRVSGQ